ncbi:hypothetical protein ACKI1H_19775 [Pseudomonas sp. YH-1]|uniref:hypothetical protein n=1 Tax=Pseudomonas sp. YH-1 TaxID=3384787 RepID=UPI003F7D9BD4
MGWNDHQDVELTDGLRRLLDEGTLDANGDPAILAQYILNHGLAALSEDQQQQFQRELLPLLNCRARSEGLMPQGELDALINDPGNEDPGSLIEVETSEGLNLRR